MQKNMELDPSIDLNLDLNQFNLVAFTWSRVHYREKKYANSSETGCKEREWYAYILIASP